MYDVLVKRLFRDRLHIANQNFIYFAKRGKSDRTQALREALDQARQRFFRKYKKTSSSTFELNIDIPARQYGLQAVDYFLWSVQRLYERGEDRYIQYLWESVSFVQDIDDTRSHNYGMYYDKKHPLTITALEGRK